MNDKKLFLIDAYSLIYRAYYALFRSPRITSDGRNTSAIFGFCNTLDDIIRKENPPYMAVCFDPPHGNTFRHEVYPEYKAQRDKQPEDITFAIPYIKKIVAAYGIKVIEMPRFEADDVIGTLASMAERDGFTTYMMTPDKDYGQLVTDKVFMYRPALKGNGFEIRGPKEVCERYGISSPHQVIDLLALEGDASDNVPGCPGVGEKTAARLIGEWGSVENLIQNVTALKGALRQKIETNAEQISFSKFLVTIKTDVPVQEKPSDLLRGEPDTDALRSIFTDLEFKSFLNRLSPAPSAANSRTDITPAANGIPSLFDMEVNDEPVEDDTEIFTVDHTIAGNAADVSTFVNGARAAGKVSISIYATGDEAMTAEYRGMALCTGENVMFIPDTIQGWMEAVAPVFTDADICVSSHNVKRDMILLRRMGMEWEAKYFDTQLAYYLLRPEQPNDLPETAMAMSSIKLQDLGSPTSERKKPLKGTAEEIAATVCARAAAVSTVISPLMKHIADEGLGPLLNDVELPLVRVLADMEWTGVRIDSAVLHRMSRGLSERMDEIEQRCWELAGGRFNIASPSQVGEVLFGRLNIDPKAKRTKKGAWSTTEDNLEKYRHHWPIVDLILQFRGLKKLLATYVDALPRLVNPKTGKIHTTYNQTVTATGRLSSTNPNLQNIPIRTEEGRLIREAFIADDGCLIVSADYSQIELRLMAAMSGDPAMTEAFISGKDIHRATAAKIYHKDFSQVTDNERRNAKTANFGIIYGISPFGLSERLAIPRAEAKALIDGYMRTYPRIQEYMNESIEKGRSDGYVSTVMGRKRYLPDINSRNSVVRAYAERNAINAPLQGSAADIIKVAMISVARRLSARGMRTRMILQVHDELVFNVPVDELEELSTLVTECMEKAWNGPVPLTVSLGTGTNWLEAH